MDIADPWLPILRKLSLSREEQAVVKRYSQDPLGRSFFPIADILRNHGLVNESVEILMQGVARHPDFTQARVILTRELLGKGMAEEAWSILEGCLESLHDNALAQKLRLKLAIMLGFEKVARDTAQHIKDHRLHDDDTARLADGVIANKIANLRDKLYLELRKDGAAPLGNGRRDSEGQESEPTAANHLGLLEPWEEAYSRVAGFHVVPLREVFAAAEQPHQAAVGTVGGIEMDSLTLADIYEQQGYYQKALEVHRRLLKIMPNSDLIKRKIAQLKDQRQQQRDDDVALDPSIVDKMETMEIIDAQLKVLTDLLTRL